MISTRIVCRRFVGRESELDHLSMRRGRAGDGHGGLVLIGGEAGIGKSRLVRELRERLNRRTSVVGYGACREFAQKPLGPLLEILPQLVRLGLGDLTFSSESERLDAIARHFERLAEKRLAIVVLEDLQWADIDLIQTLLVLVQRSATKRLLFVATYRDNEIVPAHPLFKWFGQLVREPAVSVVTLKPFDDREIDRLISFALTDQVTLPLPVLRAVRERSDGNPLFAEELLRNAVDSQRSRSSSPSQTLPLSVHALIRERLRHCSDEERSLLRQASLFGRAFRVEQVCEIFGGEAVEFRPILERLCGLQLIDAVNAAKGNYQFRHALTRDVVYAEMPEAALKSLHRAIAEYLEKSPDAADVPEDLAHHFWEAGCCDRAAAYYESAADWAMSIYAYADAGALYERAAIGFERDSVACERVCARAAQALIFGGDLDAGLSYYERSVKLALEIGNLAEAVRSRALMAGHMFDGGRRSDAISLIEQTLSFTNPSEPSLRARLLTRLAMTLARDARVDEALEALRQVDHAALEPQADTTAEYHLCASELHAMRSEIEPWQRCFEEGLAIYEARGHPGPMQMAHSNFAVQALCLGETAIARTHHRIAGELAHTLRLDEQAVLLAQVELYAGELEEARRIVIGMTPSRKLIIRAIQAQVAVPLALVLGDDEMLNEYFDPALLAEAGPRPLTATFARVAAAQAMVLSAKRRPRDVRALLGRVLESINTAFGMMLPIVAIATLLPERASEFRPIVAGAAQAAGDRVNKALLALLDAQWSLHQGDAPAARRHAVDGAQRFAAIGWPLFEARCLEAAEEKKSALAIYRQRGAAGEVRRLELLGMAGAHNVPLGVLTARERELALLIASGKTNREAATELSITEKAVEKYLTSIYSKIGIKSRAQLAAYVVWSQSRAEALAASDGSTA
ncbi:MAG: AAA family ATPase [Candidatus Tumulicola sp.]